MTGPASEPPSSTLDTPTRRSGVGPLAASAAKLLGSGVVSAVALTIITSNRWQLLDPGVGISLVLFLQWQTFGLTLTKLGIDQVVFATINEDPKRRLDTSVHMRGRALPLGLAFGALVAAVFGPWYGLACFLSLMLDTDAILLATDLNARERYTGVMIASLLNYPLFFLLLFGLEPWHPVTIGLALALFVMTSFTRWAWLSATRPLQNNLPAYACQGTALTGVAPLLNHLMCRVDQVLLGTSFITTLVATLQGDFARQLLFLGRYQELLSGSLAMLSGILLPRLFLRYPFVVSGLLTTAASRPRLIIVYLFAVGSSLAAYSVLWQGSPLSPVLVMSNAVSAVLALPANVLTYSMIRQGYLRGLVLNLAIAVTLGLTVIVASYMFHAPIIFVTAVPLQLAIFVWLASARSWATASASTWPETRP